MDRRPAISQSYFFEQFILTFKHPEKGSYVLTTGGLFRPAHHNKPPKTFDTQAEAERELRRVLPDLKDRHPSWEKYMA